MKTRKVSVNIDVDNNVKSSTSDLKHRLENPSWNVIQVNGIFITEVISEDFKKNIICMSFSLCNNGWKMWWV